MKVLLISALLVLTSDVARAQTFGEIVALLSIVNKELLAFAMANPGIATGVITSVVGVYGVYGVSLTYGLYRDVSALDMWVERITQRLKDKTDENSCWCIESPPPPLEEATWTLSFFSKYYTEKLQLSAKMTTWRN